MKKRLYIRLISLLLVVATLSSISFSTISADAVSTEKIKSKVIAIAENEVGYQGTSTYSKYGEWYGYQGSWCTTFVLWCFYKAETSLDVSLLGTIVPNGGNCNSMISWYQNKNRYHKSSSSYTAKKGDLVFFDWSGNGSAQHVGIVTSVSGSTVNTIEGNCSGAVKERTYTSSGSKPYNNISAIMGYASPNWGSVADSSGKTTTKKQTTTKATTKKATTTKKHSSSKTTTKKSSTTKKSKNETTTKSTTTKVETTTKAETVEAKKMELYAPTQELEIGDSVQLDYTIKPSGANAVVGYFCDEEDIIEISDGGLITATGEGTATVVVCANDTIYKQCDFTVTAQNSDITKHYNDSERKIVGQLSSESTEMTNKTPEQRLTELGVNLSMLTENPKLYFVPLAILGVALVLSACIYLIKRFKRK